jgi:nucleoside diphosphate kinase
MKKAEEVVAVAVEAINQPPTIRRHHQKFVHARSLPIKFESIEQMKSNPVVAKLLSMPDPEKVKQLMGKKGAQHTARARSRTRHTHKTPNTF